MELQIPSVLIATFVVFLVFKFVTKTSKTQKKLPPGPWKLPFIGSLHHLAGALPTHALRDLSKKYGPIMHLQLGQLSAIVISSPKMAKEVLQTHDLAFADRPLYLAPTIMLYNNADIVFAPYGAQWRQMRKIAILELLSVKNVKSFSSIRQEETRKLIESVKSSAGSSINVTDHLFVLTNSVTSRAAFGKKNKDEAAFKVAMKEGINLTSGFALYDLYPSLKIFHVITGIKAKIENVQRKLDRILESVVTDHIENTAVTKGGNGESGEEDLVDVLLRHQKSGDLEVPITTNQIKALIMDIFTAGTDTSSTTTEWAMSELMRNPKVMEKLQGELRNSLKGKKTIQQTDVQNIKYLNAVIKETLRLHPPVPLLVPHICRENCVIEGYEIPVKTQAIVNVWAIGRDPEHWKDPESFMPERFHESSIEFIGNDFRFIPFGAGRRMCPGMSFGLANVELPLAQLLYYFDWKLPGGMKPEDLDMTENFGATVGRKSELHLIATPYGPAFDE